MLLFDIVVLGMYSNAEPRLVQTIVNYMIFRFRKICISNMSYYLLELDIDIFTHFL